jgi:hypothetical protein
MDFSMHRKSALSPTFPTVFSASKVSLLCDLGFSARLQSEGGLGLSGFIIKHPLFLEDFMRSAVFSLAASKALCAFSARFSKPRNFYRLISIEYRGREAAVSAAFASVSSASSPCIGLCFPQFVRHNALCGNSTK